MMITALAGPVNPPACGMWCAAVQRDGSVGSIEAGCSLAGHGRGQYARGCTQGRLARADAEGFPVDGAVRPQSGARPIMPVVDDLIDQVRVKHRQKIQLKDHDPAWAGDPAQPKAERKRFAQEILTQDVSALAEAQDRLYATDCWSILIILQGMDASGKDSTIKHVMSGVNPQGCEVTSFKHPSAEELDHNFLWRYARRTPERGRIGIFNRSYYEEVLIVRVHPELVRAQNVPNGRIDDDFWADRFADINAFERHLTRNGTVILKFFLHISKDEQCKRFLERLKDPAKQWKFAPADLAERRFWDEYMKAYQDALSATSTKWAPWHIIPADHKWVARALVARIVTHAVESLDLRYPDVTDEQHAIIEEARKQLEKGEN
jgi:PPK2 family polyphosphate:nucleotide phosphotransferase